MTINRNFFFSHVRTHLFDGSLRQAQVAGLALILDKWEAEMATADDRWLAYMLATTHHETDRTMQPVREAHGATDDIAIGRLESAWRRGRLPWVSQPYWRRDAEGKSWLGRGYVQLTHKANYLRMSRLLGLDLVTEPDKVMQPPIAADILFKGMSLGSFTAKKLADYFVSAREDWVNARRIINGLDKAELVGSYARRYYAAISHTV